MKAFYCDHFELPLPPGHRFPMNKYSLLRQRVLSEGIVSSENLIVPNPATDEQIGLVHARDYMEAVVEGSLPDREQRRIGFPWSPQLVERSRRSAGGTIAACYAALEDGAAANLAGGTHHAFPDAGEGFCVFNDAAIAIRVLQTSRLVRSVLVIDCDVHQGNGTAAIFRDDPTVFTFSIHGRNNYPFRKEASDLDVGLADGAGDDEYLGNLDTHLADIVGDRSFDLAIYVSGADPFAGDTLGRLSLSKGGLAERDRIVFDHMHRSSVPVATVMAGGYAKRVEDTVDIHVETVRAATRLARSDLTREAAFGVAGSRFGNGPTTH